MLSFRGWVANLRLFAYNENERKDLNLKIM